jgi:tetratricopeptide (TPR) repeat protein
MAHEAAGRIAVSIICIACALLLSCGGSASFGRMGAELLREGKYQAALEMYDKALQADTTEPLLMGRAGSAMQLGRYDIALRDYAAVVARNGNATAAALLGRGQAYESINNPDKAVQDYSSALEMRDAAIDRAHAHYLRARAFRALRRHDPALADCQRALDLDSSRAHVFELRGDIFVDMGSGQAAGENYARAAGRYKSLGKSSDASRVLSKARVPVPDALKPPVAPQLPPVRYRVEAADPRMQAVGEYLLLKPVEQQAEVMLRIVLGEVPDWKQDAWRQAAKHVDHRRLQERYADIMGTQLSRMELESLVKMVRLERSTDAADTRELDALKYSEYGGQLLAREQVAFTELLKAYREQLRGACLALGLGC